MRVTRSQLRKIILREFKSLLEATSKAYDAGSGHGIYKFSYEKTKNEIVVHLITHNDEPITKKLFGDEAGMITDSHGLKIAKLQFQNDNRGRTITYSI